MDLVPIELTIYALTIAMGLPMNIMLVIRILKYKDMKKAYGRSLFIMTLADMVACVTMIPLSISGRIVQKKYSIELIWEVFAARNACFNLYFFFDFFIKTYMAVERTISVVYNHRLSMLPPAILVGCMGVAATVFRIITDIYDYPSFFTTFSIMRITTVTVSILIFSIAYLHLVIFLWRNSKETAIAVGQNTKKRFKKSVKHIGLLSAYVIPLRFIVFMQDVFRLTRLFTTNQSIQVVVLVATAMYQGSALVNPVITFVLYPHLRK